MPTLWQPASQHGPSCKCACLMQSPSSGPGCSGKRTDGRALTAAQPVPGQLPAHAGAALHLPPGGRSHPAVQPQPRRAASQVRTHSLLSAVLLGAMLRWPRVYASWLSQHARPSCTSCLDWPRCAHPRVCQPVAAAGVEAVSGLRTAAGTSCSTLCASMPQQMMRPTSASTRCSPDLTWQPHSVVHTVVHAQTLVVQTQLLANCRGLRTTAAQA